MRSWQLFFLWAWCLFTGIVHLNFLFKWPFLTFQLHIHVIVLTFFHSCWFHYLLMKLCVISTNMYMYQNMQFCWIVCLSAQSYIATSWPTLSNFELGDLSLQNGWCWISKGFLTQMIPEIEELIAYCPSLGDEYDGLATMHFPMYGLLYPLWNIYTEIDSPFQSLLLRQCNKVSLRSHTAICVVI